MRKFQPHGILHSDLITSRAQRKRRKHIKVPQKNIKTNFTNEKSFILLLKPTTAILRTSSSVQGTVDLNRRQILKLVVEALFRTSRAKTGKEVRKADNLGKSITLERAQATAQTHVRFSPKIALIRTKLGLSKTLQLPTSGTTAPISILELLGKMKIRIQREFGVS